MSPLLARYDNSHCTNNRSKPHCTNIGHSGRWIVIAFRAFLLVAWLVTAYLVFIATIELGVAGSLVWFTDFAQPWRFMFYTDFTFYLLFVGLWILYREESSVVAISCAVASAALGSIFTLGYLLVTTFRCKNDFHRFLLGHHADKLSRA